MVKYNEFLKKDCYGEIVKYRIFYKKQFNCIMYRSYFEIFMKCTARNVK